MTGLKRGRITNESVSAKEHVKEKFQGCLSLTAGGGAVQKSRVKPSETMFSAEAIPP